MFTNKEHSYFVKPSIWQVTTSGGGGVVKIGQDGMLFGLGMILGLMLLLWNSHWHVPIKARENKCCLSLQRWCSEKGDITSTVFSVSLFYSQVWFSSFHAPTPLLIHPSTSPLFKKKNYLHKHAYIFQELYYAYKLDLDCVTNLVGYSVIQEITAYGSICPYEPLS